MLFLGAGSSRPFGIGSLEGISRLAKESVTPAVRTIIEGLESILEQYRDLPTNFRVDIEILLTVFNSLANRRDLLIAYGPVALIMDHFLRESHEFQSIQITRQEYESFRELVAEIITNEMNRYIRSTQDRRRARELYDDLFQISIRSNSKFRNAMGGDAFGAFNIVATTNYDLVLEIYGNESNLPGVHRVLTERGFLREPGIDALNMVGMRERTIDLSYIKLHGSIDWWHTAEGKIILNMGSENPYHLSNI